MTKHFSNFKAIISLIFVNLVPIWGVLYQDWNVFSLIIIYWFENVIIGFLNLQKMKKAEGKSAKNIKTVMKVNGKPYTGPVKSFFVPFFLFHYGMFTFIHGIFVATFFYSSTIIWRGVISTILLMITSHTISYYTNYLGNEEYKRTSVYDLFLAPYKRVIVMHLTIIFGAFFAIGQENATPALLIMVLLKTLTDLGSHLFEHRNS